MNAKLITYAYTGEITQVTTNDNDIIPNLSANDLFAGQLTIESTGWDRSIGTVTVTINGVDLVFSGEFVYGNVEVVPLSKYSIRVAGDTGGDIGSSSFSAFAFGPLLIDSDGSSGHTVPFPETLNLPEFETNSFGIVGRVRSTGDFVNATGRLNSFTIVPEPNSLFVLCMISTPAITLGRQRVAN